MSRCRKPALTAAIASAIAAAPLTAEPMPPKEPTPPLAVQAPTGVDWSIRHSASGYFARRTDANGSGGAGGAAVEHALNDRGTLLRVLIGANAAYYGQRRDPTGRAAYEDYSQANAPMGIEQRLGEIKLGGRKRPALRIIPRVGAGASFLGLSATTRVLETDQGGKIFEETYCAAWTVVPYVAAGVDVASGKWVVGGRWEKFFDTVHRRSPTFLGARLGMMFDGNSLTGE